MWACLISLLSQTLKLLTFVFKYLICLQLKFVYFLRWKTNFSVFKIKQNCFPSSISSDTYPISMCAWTSLRSFFLSFQTGFRISLSSLILFLNCWTFLLELYWVSLEEIDIYNILGLPTHKLCSSLYLILLNVLQ